MEKALTAVLSKLSKKDRNTPSEYCQVTSKILRPLEDVLSNIK